VPVPARRHWLPSTASVGAASTGSWPVESRHGTPESAECEKAELVYPTTGEHYRAHSFAAVAVEGQIAAQDPEEIFGVSWYDLADLPEPLTPSAAAAVAGGVRRQDTSGS
jgi:hypothetical protein